MNRWENKGVCERCEDFTLYLAHVLFDVSNLLPGCVQALCPDCRRKIAESRAEKVGGIVAEDATRRRFRVFVGEKEQGVAV